MQYFKLIPAVIFSTGLLYACSGNSAASTTKDNTSNNTTNTNNDSTYYGKNSVAYSINGRHVAIKDQLKYGEGKYISALYINEVKNVDDGMIKLYFTNSLTSEVFKFVISNKGTTNVLNAKPSLANVLNKKAAEATYMGLNLTNYYAESVAVAITAIDDKHVAGTFSGKFSTDDNSKQPVEIKDGSFDVLFTKDKGN